MRKEESVYTSVESDILGRKEENPLQFKVGECSSMDERQSKSIVEVKRWK